MSNWPLKPRLWTLFWLWKRETFRKCNFHSKEKTSWLVFLNEARCIHPEHNAYFPQLFRSKITSCSWSCFLLWKLLLWENIFLTFHALGTYLHFTTLCPFQTKCLGTRFFLSQSKTKKKACVLVRVCACASVRAYVCSFVAVCVPACIKCWACLERQSL